MAIRNKAWRETVFDPPGAEPGLTYSREFAENVQNRAVQEIARTRFPFPSRDLPAWKTYVNRPEHTIGVRARSGDLLFPDIVVMDTETTETHMLGEIETPRSLRLPDVVDKWAAFASAGRLYLFVPYTQLDRARRLLSTASIKPAGFRLWKLNMGQGKVEVLELPV